MADNPPPFVITTELDLEHRAKEFEFVDCVFCDPMGQWHHCTYHESQVSERDIKNGFAFDGSSIKLLTNVGNSDMAMKPSINSTAWMDPFCDENTLHVICDICGPFGEPQNRCPRGIATRCTDYVKKHGIADTIMIGPEAEFFVFDNMKHEIQSNKMSFCLDGEEGLWNSNSEYQRPDFHSILPLPKKSFYFPVSPIDSSMNLRSEMLKTMKLVGLPIEKHHHEVAANQIELGFACRPLVEAADFILTYKYVAKNVAKKKGYCATFMPKPIHDDNGSGMHLHQSLWKDGQNKFFDIHGEYHKISQMALWYIGGIIEHAHSILAFTNPTTNSYKRLIPGFEAPASLVYSKGNRSAAIRIPLADVDNPKLKRLEFRCPDPAANPYLAISAMVMAGVDGILKKIEPPAPMDKDAYELTDEEKKNIKLTPESLSISLDALEKDNDYLTAGGVFPIDFINAYIKLKREEYKSVNRLPHPKEFELYGHC